MALDEEEIVRFIMDRLESLLHDIRTKSDFKTFLNNLTKVKIRNFLKTSLEEYAVQREQGLATETTTIADIRKIKDYLDTL